MHPFPHHYHVQAQGSASGSVRVATTDAPALDTHAPPEFDGPPGYWSPESLLVASVADCYILSFRGVARASKLEWTSLHVDVEGVLDRVEGVSRFVRFTVKPRLSIASPDRETLARTVLDKAKRTCLVTNSLTAQCELVPSVTFPEAAPAAQ
ncbi:MAG: OsmC family protein [Ramlibacter sp.]